MIETRPFGSTGHESSRVIFGAAALSSMTQEQADVALADAGSHGLNHVDTAPLYGDSELRLASFLAENRSEVFLATKTGDRSGAAARASLERSLERMGVDSIDLIQLHNLVEEDDWQEAFSPGGAVEALFSAREHGLCGHVGVTGHGLRIARMHLRSIEEAPMASVLLPWNHSLATIESYAADFEELAATCSDRGIAVQTIKSVARRRWAKTPERRFSWYEPMDDDHVAARAVQFVLADDRLFLNTSSDIRLFEVTVDAALQSDGAAPPPSVLADDRERHAITPIFDGAELEVI